MEVCLLSISFQGYLLTFEGHQKNPKNFTLCEVRGRTFLFCRSDFLRQKVAKNLIRLKIGEGWSPFNTKLHTKIKILGFFVWNLFLRPQPHSTKYPFNPFLPWCVLLQSTLFTFSNITGVSQTREQWGQSWLRSVIFLSICHLQL